MRLSERNYRSISTCTLRAFGAVIVAASIHSATGLADESHSSTKDDGAAMQPSEAGATQFNTGDEWNFSIGGGYAHVIRNSAGHTSVAEQSIRWGRVFSESQGGRWYQGAWQYGVEFHPAFFVLQDEAVYGVGVTPMIHRFFTPHGKLMPTLGIGLGVLAATKKVPKDEARFNFTPQLALGTYYFFRPTRALVLEYRFHHISNAGQTKRNPSINSSMLVVGLSFFK